MQAKSPQCVSGDVNMPLMRRIERPTKQSHDLPGSCHGHARAKVKILIVRHTAIYADVGKIKSMHAPYLSCENSAQSRRYPWQ